MLAASVATLADIPDGHKVLDVSGLDRIYLNGYVPGLMTSGQLVGFLAHWVPRSLPGRAGEERERLPGAIHSG